MKKKKKRNVKMINKNFRCMLCDEMTLENDHSKYFHWSPDDDTECLLCGDCAKLMKKRRFKFVSHALHKGIHYDEFFDTISKIK